MRLRRFQKRFLFGALSEGVRTARSQIPSGNGKTTWPLSLPTRIINPLSSLFTGRYGDRTLICGVAGPVAPNLIPGVEGRSSNRAAGLSNAFRISENRNECSITHLPTSIRGCRFLAPKSATAQGLVRLSSG